jgi:hypothetical protein
MTALEVLLAGLIDYAGLYPPASLDMRTAVHNYLSFSHGKHTTALGRFLVDIHSLAELREVAGDSAGHLRLSVLASAHNDGESLEALLQERPSIETLEIKLAIKINQSAQIALIERCIATGLTIYIEVPFDSRAAETIATIAATGARVKLRMGGIVADAFPSSQTVATILKALADRRTPFKATAGLHHPIRSHHPFTDAPDSPAGLMHGFLNLACAATLLYFGGEIKQAICILDEQDPAAWTITSDAITWRNLRWSTEQLRSVRKNFLTSFGSCSFTHPIHDLETLGWL